MEPKLWIKSQEKINIDKKIRFFKTHNTFVYGNIIKLLNGNTGIVFGKSWSIFSFFLLANF